MNQKFIRRTKEYAFAILLGMFSLLIASACHWADPFLTHSYPINSPKPGLVFYDYWRTGSDVNLVNDDTMKTCRVIAMNGKELGQLPGGFCLFLPDGKYFSNHHGPSLFDTDFQLLWSRPEIENHHEAIYDARRNRIWLFAYERETVRGKKILYDRLLALDLASGRTVFSWRPDEGLDQLARLTGVKPVLHFTKHLQGWSYTHLNSIALGEGDELLISDTGSMGSIYTFNITTRKITWAWRPESSILKAKDQHSAHYLPNGRILTFINNTGQKASPEHGLKRSFLAILNPKDGQLEWTYSPKEGSGFFSIWFGNVTPVENGNYLVTHIGNGGGAFEVTPQGRVVWEWNNDLLDEKGLCRPLYRVTRAPRTTVEPYLRQWAKISNIP